MNRWRRFVARHIIADDPHPELSWLDRMDGLSCNYEDLRPRLTAFAAGVTGAGQEDGRGSRAS